MATEKQLKYWASLKGKTPTYIFPKGNTPWNKGTRGLIKPNSGSFKKGEHKSPETEYKKGNISWSKLNRNKMPIGEKHWEWKGNKVGYVALHSWVNRSLGKPSKCEFCKTTNAKRFEWANKSRLYKRDLDDWLRLCKSCHEQYDNRIAST